MARVNPTFAKFSSIHVTEDGQPDHYGLHLAWARGARASERHAVVRAEGIFVYFADFEDVAKQEVHDLASTGPELDEFTASLGIADQFWCTQRFAGPPIVFVHTDEQACALKASDLPATWADTYFDIAKRHDEFGYLTRAEIAIHVDSKENFDVNYSSNWFYYFK
jgi:hypothetical protein